MSPRNPKLNGGFHGNIIENGGFTIVMFGKWRVIGLMYPLIRCSISKGYNLCVHGIQWISKTNNHIYGAPHRSTVIYKPSCHKPIYYLGIWSDWGWKKNLWLHSQGGRCREGQRGSWDELSGGFFVWTVERLDILLPHRCIYHLFHCISILLNSLHAYSIHIPHRYHETRHTPYILHT